MIIARYITKEILYTFGIVTTVVLFVLISNKFVTLISKAAAGKMPLGFVLKIMGLYIPEFFSLLAPVTFFIALLFSLGRLHTDSEVAVLLTSGFDWGFFTRVVMSIAVFIALLVGIFSLWLVPSITEYREQMLAEGEAVGIMQAIVPGRFQLLNDGQVVFYIEDIDGKTNKLSNIFIAEQVASGKSAGILTALGAKIEKKQDSDDYYLILENGHRYTGVPGTKDYTVVSFSEYGREVKTQANSISSFDRLQPTIKLLGSNIPSDVAELQWRCAKPISVLILALIAISLSKVQPRQGRFAKFLPAVLLYIAYYNLMTLVKRSVENAVLPQYLGLWWVHGIFLCLGVVFLAHTSGRLFEFKLEVKRWLEKKHENKDNR